MGNMVRFNTAEGGVSGTTVTTSNSGAVSGYPFTGVALGASATAIFDNAQAQSGSLSYKLTTVAAAASLQFGLPPVPVSQVIWTRIWVMFSGSIPASARILNFGGVTFSTFIDTVSSSGIKWRLNQGTATPIIGTTTPVAGTWYRLELQNVVGTASSQATARIYDNSGTLLETIGPITFAGNSIATIIYFGQVASVACTLWIDNPAVSNLGWIGATLSLPFAKSNNAEGGSNGTALTTANTGGVSGDAFDTANAAITFSNDTAADGSLSYKVSPTGAGQVFTWSYGNLSATYDIYIRGYFRFTSLPSSVAAIFIDIIAANNATTDYVVLTPTGKMQVQAGSKLVTGTVTYSVNTWYRVDFHVHADATAGYTEIFVYDASNNLLEHINTSTNALTNSLSATGLANVYFGVVSAITGGSYYFDNISVSDQGWPVIPQQAAAMFEVM